VKRETDCHAMEVEGSVERNGGPLFGKRSCAGRAISHDKKKLKKKRRTGLAWAVRFLTLSSGELFVGALADSDPGGGGPNHRRKIVLGNAYSIRGKALRSLDKPVPQETVGENYASVRKKGKNDW